jgi:glycosyltransferase involved in cell wall biosynthesis
MVRFALDSIEAQHYDNLDVAIIDDGSVTPIEPLLKDYSFKWRLFNTHDSVEYKLANGGSRHGQMINEAIDSSDADIAVILCDDDALATHYLHALDEYYTRNPYIQYSYGHVAVFNPYESPDYARIASTNTSPLNDNVLPIDPYCLVDASQVSWKLDAYKFFNITFPYPHTTALDAEIYRQLYENLGPCVFNGLTAQYKGVYSDQMGNRKNLFQPTDKESYGV